jgi:hypothetical protein
MDTPMSSGASIEQVRNFLEGKGYMRAKQHPAYGDLLVVYERPAPGKDGFRPQLHIHQYGDGGWDLGTANSEKEDIEEIRMIMYELSLLRGYPPDKQVIIVEEGGGG